jgi:glycosyltransferase involved in cell wall biosynthesis
MPINPTAEVQRLNLLPQAGSGRLKRVLFVLGLDPSGKFGSIEEQTLTLARAFRERRSLFLPVFLRPLDPESATQYASEGLPVEALDLRQFRFATLRRLLHLVRQNRIEVVHWNFYHPLANGYLWILSVLKPRIEHYFTDHISRPARGPDRDERGNLTWILKWPLTCRYRKILCVSDYVLDQLQVMHCPNLQRTPCFVNTERFRPDPDVRREVRAALGVGDEFVALIVAYLIKDKGVDVALRALAEMPRNVVLWIIGAGPEHSNLQALAQNLELGPQVRFLGPHRYVEPLMQASDCVICPSVWAEAACLVNLEALACGLPVIASRIGGIPEFVEDGRTGFLFTPGDHQKLADRFHKLLSDEPARHLMSQEARLVAVKCYSTQSLIGDHLSLYVAGQSRLLKELRLARQRLQDIVFGKVGPRDDENRSATQATERRLPQP